MTANPGEYAIAAGAVSPDGRYVAYSDKTGLYLRAIDSGEIRAIKLPAELRSGLYRLQWFPTGGRLLASSNISAGGAIYVVTVLGETEPRRLYEGRDAAISPDGRTIAFTTGNYTELWVGDVDGQTPRKLTSTEETSLLSYLTWSPDSRWVAYGRTWKDPQGFGSAAVEAREADSGLVRTLVAEGDLPDTKQFVSLVGGFSQAWLPDWTLVFANCKIDIPHQECSLWRVPIEASRVEAAGKPRQITPWNRFTPTNLTATADGKRLALAKVATWDDVYVGDLNRQGDSLNSVRRLTWDQRGSQLNDWTRDGLSILFTSERNGRSEIFKQQVSSNIAEVMVTGRDNVCAAQLAPDGSGLFYLQSRAGTPCWESTG